jgi:dolichol-phosphate mannosyltransferase
MKIDSPLAVAEAPPRLAPQTWSSTPTIQNVTVVIPLYNEQDVVPLLFDSLHQFEIALADRFQFDFLLIDDGSCDETFDLAANRAAEKANYEIVRLPKNRGIAAAIQKGISLAKHDIVVSMDCDGSYDPLLAAELIPLLTPGVDLVTASPYHVTGRVENVPLWRLRLSRLASRLYSAVCGPELTCYTSCFRVYRKSRVEGLRITHDRFVGVAELLWRVIEQGGQVVEHPALLRSRVAGHSKMKVVRASLGHLKLLTHIAVTSCLKPPRRKHD